MGYAIVVDASVARAAGETQNIIAQKCREVLDGIFSHDHQLALSKPTYDEWLKKRSEEDELSTPYASRYAIQWLTKMTSQRDRIKWIEISEHQEFIDQIVAAAPLQDQIQVKKDCHLVATAIASDRRVVSNDGKIRKHFQNIGGSIKVLCEILWLNPINMPLFSGFAMELPIMPNTHCAQTLHRFPEFHRFEP